MSRLLKEIAPHNAPGPRAMTTTPCLVCGDDGEGMDCCPAALCTPCLQRAAKAQGSLFRCPLCRDDGAFVIAAKRRGVVANAKATPRYASGDDLTIRRRCNAPRCKAPGGRFVDAAENPLTRHGNTEKWALATCAHCGQTSRHRGCVKRFEGFRCDDCDVQVLERTPDDFRKGDRVEARFSGGPRWYGAEVVAVVEEGIRVKYDDDGSLETIRVAARIRHRAAEEDRSPPRSRRDEDEDEDDDEGAMRALRERVERDGGDALTVVRLDALLAGWKGSRRKKYTTGRAGFAYSFVAPDGTEIASIGRAAAAVLEAVPAADAEAATAEAPAPAAAAVRGTTAPSYDHGVRCEVRRVGDARWRRFASWRDAAQAFGVRHASNLSRLANGDPKLPAWVREQYEARRLADDDDDDAPAADESSVYNEAALRALRERVERDSGDEMTAARLDALLAGWKGSRERKLTHGRPNGFAYSFVAPDGTEITSITAAAAAVLGAAAAPTDETAAAEAPAPGGRRTAVEGVPGLGGRRPRGAPRASARAAGRRGVPTRQPARRVAGDAAPTSRRDHVQLYLARRRRIHVRLPRRLGGVPPRACGETTPRGSRAATGRERRAAERPGGGHAARGQAPGRGSGGSAWRTRGSRGLRSSHRSSSTTAAATPVSARGWPRRSTTPSARNRSSSTRSVQRAA